MSISAASPVFSLPVAIAILLASPASAKTGAAAETAQNDRWSVLVTYGDDICPQGEGDEIIVCAQRPESERFRIPKDLREKAPESVTEQSWTSNVDALDDTARTSRPNSCSAVGSNGFTGCTAEAMRQWFAEQRLAGKR